MNSTCPAYCSCSAVCRTYWEQTPQSSNGSPQPCRRTQHVRCSNSVPASGKKRTGVIGPNGDCNLASERRNTYRTSCAYSGVHMVSGKPSAAPCPQSYVTGKECSLWKSCSPCTSASCPYMARTCQRQSPVFSGMGNQTCAPSWGSMGSSCSQKYLPARGDIAREHPGGDKRFRQTPFPSEQFISPTGPNQDNGFRLRHLPSEQFFPPTGPNRENGFRLSNLPSELFVPPTGPTRDEVFPLTHLPSEQFVPPTGRKYPGPQDCHGLPVVYGIEQKTESPPPRLFKRTSTAAIEDDYSSQAKRGRRQGDETDLNVVEPVHHDVAKAQNTTIDLDNFWRKYMSRIFQMSSRAAGMSARIRRAHERGGMTACRVRCKRCKGFHARRIPGRRNMRGAPRKTLIDLTDDAAYEGVYPVDISEEKQPQIALPEPRDFNEVFNTPKPVQRRLSTDDRASRQQGYALDYDSMPRLVGVLPSGLATMISSLKQ